MCLFGPPFSHLYKEECRTSSSPELQMQAALAVLLTGGSLFKVTARIQLLLSQSPATQEGHDPFYPYCLYPNPKRLGSTFPDQS